MTDQDRGPWRRAGVAPPVSPVASGASLDFAVLYPPWRV